MLRYRPGVALIVVDVQNDFADPAGSLNVAGGEAVIPVINGEIDLARSNGALVVHPGLASRAHAALRQGRRHLAGPLRPGHLGRELHPALEAGDAPIVRKGTNGEDGYSGFTMRDPTTGETIPTPLDALLREAGVDEVVVTASRPTTASRRRSSTASSATRRRCSTTR